MSLQSCQRLWSNRVALAKGTAVGLVLAGVVAAILPNVYRSSIRLLPSVRVTKPSPSDADLELFAGILQSRTVADRVIDELQLKARYRTDTYDEARRRLAANTRVTVEHDSGSVRIEVEDHKAQEAAALARAYVEQLERVAHDITGLEAHSQASFLQQRVAASATDSKDDARKLSEFAGQHSIVDLEAQEQTNIRMLNSLRQARWALERQVKQLSELYGPDNDRIRSLQAQIASLGGQALRIAGDPKTGEGATMERFSPPSGRMLASLEPELSDLSRNEIQHDQVAQSLEIERDLVHIQESAQPSPVFVLDQAEIAETKSWPPRIPLTLFGGVFGFLSVIGWMLAAPSLAVQVSPARWRTALSSFSNNLHRLSGRATRTPRNVC